jgi:hypothetical protein
MTKRPEVEWDRKTGRWTVRFPDGVVLSSEYKTELEDLLDEMERMNGPRERPTVKTGRMRR